MDFKYDSVVLSVLEKIKSRARVGKEKYGTDLDRNDLSIIEWINHAQEEHMDAILYLEKLKKELEKNKGGLIGPAENRTRITNS